MVESTEIIEQYARHLEQKASSLITRFTIRFGLVGAVLGGFPLVEVENPLVPSNLGYATLLLGALAAAYLGYRHGERKAIEPRLQARMALRQLQVEQSLIRRVAPPAAPPQPARAAQPAPAAPPHPVAPAPAPQPVPQPVAAPRPVVPAPVLQPVVPAPPPVVAPAPVSPPPVTPAPAAVAAPPLSSAAQ